jgi:hypothetical protein
MKFLFLYIVASLLPVLLPAQDEDLIDLNYTFVEDRQFIKESDIYGYTFVPHEGKMSTAHYPDPIKAGLVSFTISNQNLTVDERATYTPAGISNVISDAKPYYLHIARINKTTFGFEISLVNMRNRELQGHLKVYINAISQVAMLKYRPSMADHEHTYMIKRTSKRQGLADGKFFTHQEDFDARTLDEFWGKTLSPFMSLENASEISNRRISRIYREDEINIKFVEKFVLKGKKEKLSQFIFFKTMTGGTSQYLVKKVKEIEYQNSDGERTVLELQVRDEQKEEDSFIILHRGVKSMLKAIEVQDGKTRSSILYYEMRKGKRILK